MRAASGVGRWPGALGAVLVVATMLAALGVGGGAPAVAQEETDTTPSAGIPTAPPVDPAAETPVPDPPPASAPAPATAGEIDPGAPHVQTIAQGLVVLDGTVVWRVREVAPPPAAQATAEAAGFSFTLQRDGTSIVRNEVTGRRARLEPGEAYFMSAEDAYTRSDAGAGAAASAPGDPSRAWVFELVAPNAPVAQGLAAGTVLFTSDTIADYPSGTFDAELLRGVLLPNETATLPPHTGPALVMVTFGRVQATEDGAASVPLDAGIGRLAAGALTLRNAETAPAVYVVAAIGDIVDAPGAAPAAPAAGATATPASSSAPAVETPVPATDPAPLGAETPPAAELAAPTAAPAAEEVAVPPAADGVDTDGDGLSDDGEAAVGSDPLNRDYDADGLLDGPEVNQYGTDPLNNDSDGDGILDGDDVNQYGSDPLNADTDGDGLGDGDEVFVYGTSPTNPDTDGDGATDGEEVLTLGTDPTDPASGP